MKRTAAPGLPLAGKAPPSSWSNPDAVYTPPHLARFLVELLPWSFGRTPRILEPSVGGGAWIDAIGDHFNLGRQCDHVWESRGACVKCHRDEDEVVELVGVDVDPHCRGASLDVPGFEFRLGDVRIMDDLGTFDRAIGNPPYSAIPEHVDRALELAVEVAFLLPLDILGGGDRIPGWLARSPLRAYWPLLERPWPKKLRGCGFFWWDRTLSPLNERLDEPVGFPARSWR